MKSKYHWHYKTRNKASVFPGGTCKCRPATNFLFILLLHFKILWSCSPALLDKRQFNKMYFISCIRIKWFISKKNMNYAFKNSSFMTQWKQMTQSLHLHLNFLYHCKAFLNNNLPGKTSWKIRCTPLAGIKYPQSLKYSGRWFLSIFWPNSLFENIAS